MIEEVTQFLVGTETLVGCFIKPEDSDDPPKLLFLHGFGRMTRKSFRRLAVCLADEHRIGSFSFDFSGQGESSGKLSDSSLQKRNAEAIEALRHAQMVPPISLCAFSMGGHVALSLLDHAPVRSVVLFCPVIYADAVEAIPFDSQFKAIVTQRNNWRSSRLFKAVEHFHGKLSIVTGEKDRVVPAKLADFLMAKSPVAEHTRQMIIPDATHLLLNHIYSSTDTLHGIANLIAMSFSELSSAE